MVSPPLIALDIGGSWLRATIVSPDGQCGPIRRRATNAGRPADHIAADIAALVRELMAEAPEATGVSAAIAAPLDHRSELLFAGKFPTFDKYPLRQVLERSLGLPVLLRNDAACFAVGEWWRGQVTDARNFCGLTVGTSIGCGLILNGGLYVGSQGWSGEIWACPLEDSYADNRACGDGLEQLYAKRTGRLLSGPDLHELALSGDAVAVQAFETLGASLGKLAANIINLLAPDVICVGGSVSRAYGCFREALEAEVHKFTVPMAKTRIMPSTLGEQATMLGAAWLAWHDGRVATEA